MHQTVAAKLLKFDIENTLHQQNAEMMVIGCDEVGRGCIAGPIVGGAVYWDSLFIKSALDKLKVFLDEEIGSEVDDKRVGEIRKILIKKITNQLKLDKKQGMLEENNSNYDLFMLLQIDDSKKLSQKKRGLLSKYIKEKARAYSIFEISAEDIDNCGVGEANRKVLENSASNILNLHGGKKAGILVDHFNIFSSNKDLIKIPITKGDQKSISIGAASIIAKVYRDELMQKYHLTYPQYQFDSNVGYGTASNISAIKQHGLSPLHRKSFCKNLL